MSTTGRHTSPSDAALESAGFVRIAARADGDALAAAGILARALSELETAFQVTVGRTITERTSRIEDGDDHDDAAATVAIGAVDADVPRLEVDDRPATLAAVSLVRELGVEPDLALALAGAFTAGVEPGAGETESLLETASDGETVERRPGVAVPTPELADGLAHSTLCHAPWSGDRAATRELLADLGADELAGDLDDDTHRRVGSLVALEVVGDENTGDRAAAAVTRLLGPHATPAAPFATVGGYADVLAATARTAPGTGVALAIGHDVSEPALEAWRTHATRAHDALAAASTGRYDGLFVVDAGDGPVETVARLAADYRSPEPTVLAVGDGEAALYAREESIDSALEEVARELEAEYDVGNRRGYLQYDPQLEDATVIAAVRDR